MNSAAAEIGSAGQGHTRRSLLGSAAFAAAATAHPLITTSPAAAQGSLRASGPMAFWPSHPFYSHKLLRTISKANSGAADFTEAYIAAQAVGDVPTDAALAREFRKLGNALLDRAAAMQRDDPLGAARARLRASEYLRTAEFHIPPDTRLAAKVALYKRVRRTFIGAVAHAGPRITAVNVPYGRSALYAYRVLPPGASRRKRHPTVILYGGLDSLGEEVYLWVGEQLARRGVCVLVVDGPGQGATLRLRGIPSRHDYEVATKAVIDYLVAQRYVDRKRLGLIGVSLGGYYAARSARDRRVRATVAWTGMWDVLGATQAQRDPETLAFLARQGQWVMGAKGPLEALSKVSKFKMAGVAGRIRNHILIAHGEDDDLVPVAQAHRLYDAVRAPKDIHIYPSGTPGSSHCQIDSLPTAWEVVIPWLLDRLHA